MNHYNCGQLGHPTCRCLEKFYSLNQDKKVAYAKENRSCFKENEVDQIDSKKSENLIFRTIIIKQLALDEPKHRRALFRIKCKILGKFCNVVVDSSSIDNIILEEAIEKLKLTKIPHVNTYKVTWLNKGLSILVNE